MLQRIKEVFRKAKQIDLETLEMLKKAIMFFIVVDLFGIYYYLGLETLGSALLIICVMGLATVLLLEKQKYNNLPVKPKIKSKRRYKMENIFAEKTEAEETEEEKSEEKSKDKKDEEDKTEEALGIGLPDSDEYNKRLMDAF